MSALGFRDRLETALCPLTLPVLVFALLPASFFFRPCLFVSVYICVSVSYLGYVCLSVSPSAALYLALSFCICFSVSPCLSLLPSTSLYLAGSLQMPLCHCLYLCLCPPIPVLFLFSGLLPRGWEGSCSSPMGHPGDKLGHCLGSPFRSPPHARQLRAASVFPLQLWGVEGAPGSKDTVSSICSGAPGPLTPSASIKGARSRGSE